MTFRFSHIFISGIFAFFSLIPASAQTAAQNPPTVEPAPAAAPVTQASVPDYPEPRGLTLGIFYWFTGPGTNTGVINGHLATDNETLKDLGKPRWTPGVEISYPITRTGSLHFDGFQTHGTGNQNAPADAVYYATTTVAKGSYLATSYKIRGGKFYLDDLLFPHKFPVSRFRLKSILGVQILSMNTRIDLPLATTLSFAVGDKKLILPMIGAAAEYAISPHVLFRLEGSGFGLYKKSDIWDSAATLAVRRGHMELVGGVKALHFKTSPKKAEYLTGTLAGAFVGARWHF